MVHSVDEFFYSRYAASFELRDTALAATAFINTSYVIQG